MKVKCPGPTSYKCGVTWERPHRQKPRIFRGEIQHHLYMFHHMEVIESHKLANKILAECEKKEK